MLSSRTAGSCCMLILPLKTHSAREWRPKKKKKKRERVETKDSSAFKGICSRNEFTNDLVLKEQNHHLHIVTTQCWPIILFHQNYYTFGLLLFYLPTKVMGKARPVCHFLPAVCPCSAHVRPVVYYVIDWSIVKVVWLDHMERGRVTKILLQDFSVISHHKHKHVACCNAAQSHTKTHRG